MIKSLKSALRFCLPEALRPKTLAVRRIQEACERGVILSGPFVGMPYVRRSCGSVLTAKLLGTYELELNAIIRKWIDCKPRLVIDVGAAEGYYAVGFARRCADTRVVAFECDAEGRQLLLELARLNGVESRISVRGKCDAKSLQELAQDEAPDLLVMDVEGAEFEILGEEILPSLKNTAILVELHPWVQPRISQVLTQRLERTHSVDLIHSRPRKPSDLPLSIVDRLVLGHWLCNLASEMRPATMMWLYAEPMAGTNTNLSSK